MVTQLRRPIKVKTSQKELNLIDRRNALLKRLLHVIQTSPKLARTPNKRGEQPIAFIWRLFREGFLFDFNYSLESAAVVAAIRSQLTNAWIVIETLLQVVSSSSKGNFRALHAAASTDCPLEMFQFIIDNFPEQVFELDEDGRTALDIVLSSSSRNNKSDFAKKVNMILKANPSAANNYNKKRKYALHEAVSISCHGSWENGLVLKNFIKAAPNALSSKDPQTGMYAFQIAATVGDSVDELNSTYHLLRAMPLLIDGSCASIDCNLMRRIKKRRLR